MNYTAQDALKELRMIIKDDGAASLFKTTAEYRAFLLQGIQSILDSLKEAA